MTRSGGVTQLPEVRVDPVGAENFDTEFCPRVARLAVEFRKDVWGTVNGLYVVIAHPNGEIETYMTSELHPDIQRIVKNKAWPDMGEGRV